MIEFRNVSKSFWTGQSRKIILDRASFKVELGRNMGILAPNGTGKTTLIEMMSGVEKPDEGEIVRECNVSFALGSGSVMGISGALSAKENCRYVAQLYRMDPDYIEAFCRHVCDLKEYFVMPVNKYSSGMRARFSLALLLALEFDIYLIDEGISTSTDAAFTEKAGNIMRDRLQQATVIMVSHNPAVLEEYCDYAAVLRDGQLTVFDTLEEAKQMYDYSK